MSKKRKFKSYNALSEALKRAKFVNYGGLTTILLECFLNNQGDLKASLVEARNLCEAGKFKIWRDELISKGWLNYTIGDYSRHSPGAKLLKYINKEKSISSELASIPDVHYLVSKAKEEMATKEELTQVKERVTHLEKVVTQMIEEFDPPATKDKIEKRLKVVQKG
jgi:hypothetical protein